MFLDFSTFCLSSSFLPPNGHREAKTPGDSSFFSAAFFLASMSSALSVFLSSVGAFLPLSDDENGLILSTTRRKMPLSSPGSSYTTSVFATRLSTSFNFAMAVVSAPFWAGGAEPGLRSRINSMASGSCFSFSNSASCVFASLTNLLCG